jgi:hypothetical protein
MLKILKLNALDILYRAGRQRLNPPCVARRSPITVEGLGITFLTYCSQRFDRHTNFLNSIILSLQSQWSDPEVNKLLKSYQIRDDIDIILI